MNRLTTLCSFRTKGTAVGGVLALFLLPAGVQMALAAEDPAVAALTQPTSTVEVGAGDVSDGSYKFGEYNGLEKQGGFALGNLDLFGGGRYDSDSVTRWGLHANDIGLKTGDIDLNYREQGRFKIDLGLEDFRRNLSDSYQTPFLGLGSTSLTLPPGWLKPQVPQVSATNLNYRGLSPVAGQGSVVNSSGVVVAPTAAQIAANGAIVAADTGSFHHFNMYTERKRGEIGFGVHLNRDLLLSGSFRHETRNGFKPLAVVDSAVQENSVTLPDVVDTSTDQFNLGMEYTHGKGYLRAGYYGSVFTNDIIGLRWQDPADPTRVATMSSAPSNQFHQFNLSGGLDFSSATRLVVDLSYGRGHQSEAYLSDSSFPLGLPVGSANAVVISKLANVRLSTQATRNLSLFARYKYEDRDDQTPVHTYVFYDANLAPGATASAFNAALGLPAGTLSSNVNIFANRPQSKLVNEVNLGADYALGHRQKLSAGYDWQKIERSCPASWINCSSAPESTEHTLHAQWHAELRDNLEAGVSYGYAQRRVHYDSNAWLALVPMANVTPGAPIVGATTSVYGYLTQNGLTGFGPIAGYPTVPLTGDAAIFSPSNNIVPQSLYGSRDNVTEIPGMRRFNLADRNRDKLRSSLEWQPTARLSLDSNLEYDRDDYLHTVYGLQESSSWSASIDGSYALSDRVTANAFYTHENQRSTTAGDGFVANSNVAFVGRAENTLLASPCFSTIQSRNNNAKIDPCLIWSADMRDKADTVGVSFARNGLWAHKLDLTGDVVFTQAVTDIGVHGGSYANNPFALAGAPPLPAGVPAAFLIPAAPLPTVESRTLELRLGARIALDKSSDLRLLYLYQRTTVKDFAYEGLQLGTGTEQLPTLEQPPDFAVNVFAIFYRYRF